MEVSDGEFIPSGLRWLQEAWQAVCVHGHQLSPGIGKVCLGRESSLSAAVSHSSLNLKSNLVLGNPGWRPRKSNEIQYFGGKSSVVHLKEKRPHTATEPLSFPRQPNAIWFPFRVPNPINQTLATDFSGTDTANKY